MDESDRISELPLFLLHRILSSLPRDEAARTSVLSKHWNSVWNSFPILEFEAHVYMEEYWRFNTDYFEKLGKFLNLVDKSVQKFTQNKWKMEVFTLSVCVYDKSIPMVATWIPLALHSGASHISFMASVTGPESVYYPLPETTFALKENPASSRFYHLQKLWLYETCLNDNIIADIIRNCPNISGLYLCYFTGLKTLEISKLEKLKEISIAVRGNELEIERVTVDAPRLEEFTYYSEERDLHCVIELTSCHALRKLQLWNCPITDCWLESYLSRSPLLEYLHILECEMLRNIRISSNWLKSLMLHGLGELEVVQIHASNLSSFEFSTRKNIPILLSEDVIPCSLKINHCLSQEVDSLDSFWFLKLREFIGVPAQGIHITLDVYDNEVRFDLEALRDAAIPPLVNVDLLGINLGDIRSQYDCAALIDGLLWSCHPKTISFDRPLHQSSCIKVLCEKLLGMEQPLSCCTLSHVKCWRHSFQSAKIENFGGTEDDDLSFHPNLLDSLSSLAEGQEVLCEKLLGREQLLCSESSNFKCWCHGLKSAKIENFGGIEDESFHVNHFLDSISSLPTDQDQEVRFILEWDL